MEACLAGKSVDRPPVALWRHFPVDDQAPETLAAAIIQWQKAYDWDLVKVTPASSFCLKDWGVEDTWEGSAEGTRRYTKHIVTVPEDWTRLKALDPDSPQLAAQLKCLSLLRAEFGPDTPLIQTVFAPLAQAKNLVGGEALVAQMRQNPDLVKHGLSVITETTRNFIEATRKTGVDGIFYAVQHAQAQLLTEEEFTEFGIAYDLPVLESASPLWLNMLHIHGENIYFDLVADYPVQAINWHDRDTAPSLADARPRTSSALCGGLRRETIVYGTAEDIRREAQNALEQTSGGKFVLGTGCVVEIIAPHGNLIAARKAVEK
jgi:uroporphyrinogen decarboxylase